MIMRVNKIMVAVVVSNNNYSDSNNNTTASVIRLVTCAAGAMGLHSRLAMLAGACSVGVWMQSLVTAYTWLSNKHA